MKKLNYNIKLYYRDSNLGNAWKSYFNEYPNVELLEEDICNTNCDAIVSPANLFGFMDGGLDYQLSEKFGWDLQETLQSAIAKRPLKELLVGEVIVLPTKSEIIPWLMSAPTMRFPMHIKTSINAYLAMKAILNAIKHHLLEPKIKSVAIPELGTQ